MNATQREIRKKPPISPQNSPMPKNPWHIAIRPRQFVAAPWVNMCPPLHPFRKGSLERKQASRRPQSGNLFLHSPRSHHAFANHPD
jgi:hypothetical protein